MLIFTYDVDLGGSPEDRAAFEAYLEKKTGEKCLVLDLNCTGVFRATKEGNEPVEVVFVRPVPRGSAEQCGKELKEISNQLGQIRSVVEKQIYHCTGKSTPKCALSRHFSLKLAICFLLSFFFSFLFACLLY